MSRRPVITFSFSFSHGSAKCCYVWCDGGNSFFSYWYRWKMFSCLIDYMWMMSYSSVSGRSAIQRIWSSFWCTFKKRQVYKCTNQKYMAWMSNSYVQNMASIVGCEADYFSFIYLGVLMGSNMVKTSSWDPILDKFKKKLISYKVKLLSIRGKYTLIRSVLGLLGTYYMSFFKRPKKVLNVGGFYI